MNPAGQHGSTHQDDDVKLLHSNPAELRAWLAERGAPSDFELPRGLRDAHGLGCQSYTIYGVKVSLLCFMLGEDQFVHLFVVANDALKDPAPVVSVARLADSSVRIGVQPWVSAPEYLSATSEINRAVLEAFRERGIVIPMPRREVRMLEASA